MKKHLFKTGWCLWLMLAAQQVEAQDANSAFTTSGLYVTSNTIVSTIVESLYMGPDTNFINGTLEIYAKNTWISPGALFSGNGTIKFKNPSSGGGTSGPNMIDGNAAAQYIRLNIAIDNDSGIALTQIALPVDISSAGWVDNTSSATLKTDRNLNLTVDGANIKLGTDVTGDLQLGLNAAISNYSAARMVITNNSIVSHMVKENSNTPFTFPIGIAAGDYTPATVTPQTAQTVRASVINYSSPAAGNIIAAPDEGIDRIWHIYGGGGPATLTLRHNIITNGADYNDNLGFITQYQSNGTWSSGGGAQYVSPGVHTSNSLSLGATPDTAAALFTKSSDSTSPLPLTFTIFYLSPMACGVQVHWESANESGLDRYEVERKTGKHDFEIIARLSSSGNNSKYLFTDQGAPNGPNEYRLHLVYKNTSGYDTKTITTKVSCDHQQISIFPNSAKDYLFVKGLNGTGTLRLFNNLEQLVLERNVSNTSGSDISSFAAGIYQVELSDKENTRPFRQSFVKQ